MSKPIEVVFSGVEVQLVQSPNGLDLELEMFNPHTIKISGHKKNYLLGKPTFNGTLTLDDESFETSFNFNEYSIISKNQEVLPSDQGYILFNKDLSSLCFSFDKPYINKRIMVFPADNRMEAKPLLVKLYQLDDSLKIYEWR